MKKPGGDGVHPCHHKLHESESKGEERSQGEKREGKRKQNSEFERKVRDRERRRES